MTNAVSNSFIVTNNNNFSPKASWQKGDIITGKLTFINNQKMEVDFNGKFFSMPNNINIKEKVGEDISFQIEEISSSSLKLRYMGKKESVVKDNKLTNNLISPHDILEKNKLKATEFNIKIANKVIEDNVEDDKKYFDMANKLKKDIENIINKVTEDDIENIIKENYNPEKISIDIFSNIVDKHKVAVKLNDFDKLEAKINEEVEKYAKKYGNKEELREIINSLKSYNMPINEKNIEKLKEVLKKVDSIKSLSNEDIVNILKHNKDFTIDNIYKSKHLGSISKESVNYKTDKELGYVFEDSSMGSEKNNIEELEPQIIKILESQNIKATKENIDMAKLLIKNEVPLNNETLETINNIKNNINNLSNEELLKQSIQNIIEGKNPSNINILNKEEYTLDKPKGSNIDVEKLLKDIKKIDIKDIKRVIIEGKTINLDNLIKESKDSDTSEEITLNDSQNAKAIKARLNIEEIRLKMTVEAASRLNSKGIKVEVEPVDNLVKELRNFEKEEYIKVLETNNVEVTSENVKVLEDVYEKIHTIKNMPPKVISNIINRNIDFTIEKIANSAEKELINELKLNKLLEKYDNLSTKPRADLGDKIERTFNQIDNMLDKLGIENTDKNIRAVKILAKNEMEITIENIEAIKLIDNKLTKITEGLHPNMVVNMIKDQITPIKMHIDEILQYMSNFEEQLGETSLEKIAEHIHNLESSNLSANERESLIGIYRMLTTISKSEGAAVGFLIKNNLELNLDNLFEAAKYIKNTKGIKKVINANIDDKFGMLKELRYSEKSIKEQILTALKNENIPLTKNNVNMANALDEQNIDITQKELNRIYNNNETISEFITKAYPKKLLELEKQGDLQRQLERVNELIPKEDIINKNTIEDILNKLKEISALDKETLKNIEKFGIEKNVDNLITSKLLKDNPFEFRNKMDNILKALEHNRINTTELKQSIGKIINSISHNNFSEEIERIKDNINKTTDELMSFNNSTSESIVKDVRAAENIIKHQQVMAKEDNYYQIPIMIGEELKQLNLYVLNEKNNNQEAESGMKIHLYFETEQLGSVQAYINLKGNNMDFGIYTNNKEDMELIKSFENEMKSVLSNTMYNIGNIDYSYFKGESPISSETIINAANKEHRYYDSKFEKII